MQSGHAHDINFKSKIETGRNIQESNTSSNVQKAKLLKNYVDSLERNVQKLKNEYFIQNEEIEKRTFELRVMSQSLEKIQTLQIEKHHAESVTQTSIVKLRELQKELKDLLRNELQDSKNSLQSLKKKRAVSAGRISQAFITFVKTFTPRVRKLSQSEKKKIILKSLTNINIEASKLALFESRVFQSQKQLEDYYWSSIRGIKRELNTIKAVLTQ